MFRRRLSESRYTVNLFVRESAGALRCLGELVGALSHSGRVLSVAQEESVSSLSCESVGALSCPGRVGRCPGKSW